MMFQTVDYRGLPDGWVTGNVNSTWSFFLGSNTIESNPNLDFYDQEPKRCLPGNVTQRNSEILPMSRFE